MKVKMSSRLVSVGVRKVDGEKGKEQMRDRNEGDFYTSRRLGLEQWSLGRIEYICNIFLFLLFVVQRPVELRTFCCYSFLQSIFILYYYPVSSHDKQAYLREPCSFGDTPPLPSSLLFSTFILCFYILSSFALFFLFSCLTFLLHFSLRLIIFLLACLFSGILFSQVQSVRHTHPSHLLLYISLLCMSIPKGHRPDEKLGSRRQHCARGRLKKKRQTRIHSFPRSFYSMELAIGDNEKVKDRNEIIV